MDRSTGVKKKKLEKDIEAEVCRWAKAQGILVYKFTSPTRRSVPDRLFVLPGGRVCFIEFKAPGKKPTVQQNRELNKLIGNAAYVTWTDSAENAIHWLETTMGKRRC